MREGISNIIGLDLDIKALMRGKKSTRKLQLICGSAMFLPFRGETFSKALCLDMLEHVKDDRLAIREISRVLRRDGILVVSVPNDVFPFNFWDPSYILWKISISSSRTHRHYSRNNLEEILEASSLKISNGVTHGFICYALLRWFMTLENRLAIPANIFSKFLSKLSEREFDKSLGRLGVTRFAIAKKKC